MSINLYSLTLQEYIHLSIRDSIDSKEYIDNLTLSKYSLQSANANYNISIKPNTSVGLESDSRNLNIGIITSKLNIYGGEIYTSLIGTKSEYTYQSDSYSSNTVIGYRQSLLRKWGKDYNSISLQNTKDNYDLIKKKERYVNSLIILKAIEKYYNVVLSHNNINIYEESYLRSLNDFNIANEKYKAGLVSALDVHRAKLTLLNIKRNLQISKKNYLDLLDELAYFINQDLSSEIFSKVNLEIKKIDIEKIDYNGNDILDSNFLYKEKELQLKIARKKLYKTKRDLLPDLTMDLKYRISGEGEDFSSSWNQEDEDWSISFASEYDFNTQNKEISYEIAMIEYKSIKRELEDIQRSIMKDVKNIENSFNNYKQQLEISSLKKEEAVLSLVAAKIKYEQGLSSNNDVLEAGKTLESAKLDYISVLLSYNLSFLELYNSKNRLTYEAIIGMIDE